VHHGSVRSAWCELVGLALRGRRLACSTLFPYTTLFRSQCVPLRAASHPPDGLRRGSRDVRAPTLVDPRARRRARALGPAAGRGADRKSTRLNSSHVKTSYAVSCLKKKTEKHRTNRRGAN